MLKDELVVVEKSWGALNKGGGEVSQRRRRRTPCGRGKEGLWEGAALAGVETALCSEAFLKS